MILLYRVDLRSVHDEFFAYTNAKRFTSQLGYITLYNVIQPDIAMLDRIFQNVIYLFILVIIDFSLSQSNLLSSFPQRQIASICFDKLK